MRKFPDFVAPTKVTYLERGASLQLRRCGLTAMDDPGREWSFGGEEVRIGAVADNDVVLDDVTVSRFHCKIVQADAGYVLVDLGSTNGTFVDHVRIREAHLEPGCTIRVGDTRLRFTAGEHDVTIVPSREARCGALVGGNARMRELYAILEKIAPTGTTVVIEGETGTGKEVVAQTLHALSPRAGGALVVFDCGAVPPNLVESELFGHEKGSFTGAVTTRQGLFEQADGGTLFLDELGELPLDLQPKLLRALEQREVRRVGGSRASKVDVRIVAATNRTLEDEVRAGRFRQDLYYRLSVVKLHLPALRERADDVPLLVEHFLRSGAYNRAPDGSQRVRGVARDAMAALTAYGWPGNVRELVNVVERAVSFCESDTVALGDLPGYVRHHAEAGTSPAAPRAPTVRARAATSESAAPGAATATAAFVEPGRPGDALTAEGVTFKDAKERWVGAFERDYLLALLRRHAGNISHAAREADIDRKYFRKLMRKYDLAAGDGDPDDDA